MKEGPASEAKGWGSRRGREGEEEPLGKDPVHGKLRAWLVYEEKKCKSMTIKSIVLCETQAKSWTQSCCGIFLYTM